MTMVYAMMVLSCGLAFASAADPSKSDDGKKDLERFQGTWAGIHVQHEGETGTIAGTESPYRFVFKGDKVTILADVEGASPMGTFKLDATKKPKAIDLIFSPAGSDGKNQRILGIYAFEGEALKLCYGPDGVERPTRFEAKAGSKRIAITFQRIKE